MKAYVLLGIAAALIGVLAVFAAITVTFVPGVAALYPATALEIACGVWFGYRAGFSAYIGLLGAGLISGWFSIPLGVLLSFSDAALAVSGALAVYLLKMGRDLASLKDIVKFLITGMVGSLIGSLWYNYINLRVGVLAGLNSFWFAVIGWNAGNFIVLLFIGVPLIKVTTPTLRRLNLVPQN